MESCLQIDGLVKSYGDLVLMDGFTMSISMGEKIGLIARNGMGKSTLLDIITGKEDYNSGNITFRRDLKVSYLEQSPKWPDGTKVIDACGGRADEVAAREMLTRLGVNEHYTVVDNMSGGQLKRVAIAGALLANPDFLILDEPTNDLDIATLQVLEEYIAGFKGCVVAVSHDRCFMDRNAGHLFVFEGDGRITDFPSSYSDWIEWKTLKEAEEKASSQTDDRSASSRPRNSERADAGRKLTFREKREMEQIEAELESL